LSNGLFVGGMLQYYIFFRKAKMALPKTVFFSLAQTMAICSAIMRSQQKPDYFEYYTLEEYEGL